MERKNYYPVKTDAIFKAVFSDKELMKPLLEEVLEESVEIIELKPSEMLKDLIKEHGKRLDLVVKINNKIVNIEVNGSYSKETKARNFAFLCKMHASNLDENEYYTSQETSIQINLNFSPDKDIKEKKFRKNKLYKDEYELYSTISHKPLGVNFKVIEINVDKYYEDWYNNGGKIINKKPMLTAISFRDDKELNEFSKSAFGNENIRKMRDKVSAINNDEAFISELSYYERGIKYAKSEGYVEGREEGIEHGIEQGIEQGNIENAKKMLEDNIPLDKIAKYTSLSIETLNDLANKLEDNNSN